MAEAPAKNASTEKWQAFARELGFPEWEQPRDALEGLYEQGLLVAPAQEQDPAQPPPVEAPVVDDTPAPADVVRLVPAHWDTDSVEWIGDDDQPIVIARPRGGSTGYLVAAGDADAVIEAGRQRGLSLTKEPVA